MTAADSQDRHNKNICILAKHPCRGNLYSGDTCLAPKGSPERRLHCSRIYHNTVSIRSNFINLRGNIEERKWETGK